MGKNRISAKIILRNRNFSKAKVDYSENNRYFCAYYKEKKTQNNTNNKNNYGRINKCNSYRSY